ncbi:hypothetical protein ALC53_09974 [Atta colombica]|uniref:Uncharacterized protein n=1 Tax=Atta colombica TaxID=520822 RepID=A0A195B5I2_9HYME|nr:hypothetical protein ALC53_09974 [Atta colombica]
MNVDRVCTSQPIVSITVFHRNSILVDSSMHFKVDFFSSAFFYRRCQRSDEIALPQTLWSGDPDPAGGGAVILFNEDFPTKGNEECNVRW